MGRRLFVTLFIYGFSSRLGGIARKIAFPKLYSSLSLGLHADNDSV